MLNHEAFYHTCPLLSTTGKVYFQAHFPFLFTGPHTVPGEGLLPFPSLSQMAGVIVSTRALHDATSYPKETERASLCE